MTMFDHCIKIQYSIFNQTKLTPMRKHEVLVILTENLSKNRILNTLKIFGTTLCSRYRKECKRYFLTRVIEILKQRNIFNVHSRGYSSAIIQSPQPYIVRSKQYRVNQTRTVCHCILK